MKTLLELAAEAAGAAAMGLYIRLRGHSRLRLRLWRQSAEGAGLQEITSSRKAGTGARAGDLEVRIVSDGIETHVIISGLRHLPHELGLRAEGASTELARMRGRQTDITLGDDA